MEKKRKAEKYRGLEFSYAFPAVVPPVLLSSSVCELLKHMVYLRNQIPMPFLYLQNDYIKNHEKWQQVLTVRGASYKAWLKMSNFYQNFSKILEELMHTVEQQQVQKVLVMFGSTIVSPKETIIIEPKVKVNKDGTTSEKYVKNACRSLMRTIVTSEVFWDLPTLAPVNIFILISLADNQKYSSNIFLPKLNFRLPKRGIIHQLKLTCESVSESNASSNEIVDNEFINEFGNLSTVDCEEMWYQANLSLHGYKETTSTGTLNWTE